MKPGLLTLTIVFFSIVSYGQKLQLGLTLGSNLIKTQTTSISNNFNLGAYSGIKVRYELNDKFSFSSGVFFSQRKKYFAHPTDTGSIFDQYQAIMSAFGQDSAISIPGINTDMYTDSSGMLTESYLEIPLLCSYNMNGFNVIAGPYIGFLMAGRSKGQIVTRAPAIESVDFSTFDSTGTISSFLPPAYSETTYETSSSDNFRKTDYGGIFGIGYTVNNLQFNLLYTYGIKDYRKIFSGDTDNHKAIRLTVSYLVDFSKLARPSL